MQHFCCRWVFGAGPALVPQPPARFGDRQPSRIRDAGAFGACPADLVAPAGRARRDSAGRTAGHAAGGWAARGVQFRGRTRGGRGDISHRAISDDIILIYRHARTAARAVAETGPDRQAQGAMVGLARGARSGKAARSAWRSTRRPAGSLCRRRRLPRRIAGKRRPGSDRDESHDEETSGERRRRAVAGFVRKPRARRKRQPRSAARSRRSRAATASFRLAFAGAACAWPSAAKEYRKTN